MNPERISRLLALLWLLASAGVFVVMRSGFRPLQAAVLTVWVALPLPLAYLAARHMARTPNAWRVVLVALVAAFAFGAWLYWDAFLGPSSRTESLAGLIVLHAPIYQLVLLALSLVAAWLLGRRAASGA
jgi:hypothetical protein